MIAWTIAAIGAVALVTSGCGDSEVVPPPAGEFLCVASPGLCDTDITEAPTVSGAIQVAPGAQLPDEVVSQVAHNNLDVAIHGDRLFFAFRTAPSHFAGPDVEMFVVSTADLASWRFEGAFALGTDVREPQLVSVSGRLLLYFVELGDSPAAFTPRGVWLTEWLGPGQFTPIEPVFSPGFLVWRARAAGDAIEAFGYQGGENVYSTDGEGIQVQWLRSVDGRAWGPMTGDGDGIVLEGGSSEVDAVRLDDGRVVAVARNEAGDEDGFGSKICTAEATSPMDWSCTPDPKKYDSPLVFRHGGGVYLIGRRNVTETGNYDLGREDIPADERYLAYQLSYWQSPKRCALWRVDPDTRSVSWLLDLPSRGDTCFPELIPLDDHRYLVFNYTSPLDGEDLRWIDGQSGPTLIYYTVLTMP